MKTDRVERTLSSTVSLRDAEPEQRPDAARAVLAELFELLEDYAPTWYTEELHNRAGAALGLKDYRAA